MIRNILFLSAIFVLAACSKTQEPKILTFPADQEKKVTLSLLVADNDKGRSSPISEGYRPQMQFSASKDSITCALKISGGTLGPGETKDGSITCQTPIQTFDNKLDFTMLEGGKLVGTGKLLN